MVAGRLAHLRRWAGIAGLASSARTTATRRPAGSTPTSSASGCSITRWRSCTRAIYRPSTRRPGRSAVISTAAASASISAAAIERWRRSSTGRVVFSDETVWDPYYKPDPQYHVDGIMDSLKKAAAHLPRVDAIGGSAAGVYVNNRVKVGIALPRRAAGPVQRAREGPVPRHPKGLARRALRGGQRRRGHGARRLDVARRECDSRHRARHEHGGRLRHARRQHHVVAQRACLRAG